MQGKWEYIVFLKQSWAIFFFVFVDVVKDGQRIAHSHWILVVSYSSVFCLLLSCIFWCNVGCKSSIYIFFFCPIWCSFIRFANMHLMKGFWMFWSLCQWIVRLMVKDISVWCYCSKRGHDAIALTITEKYIFVVIIIAVHIL